ncbi:glutathione S-transferase N-terminal domain-containing protein [Salinicola halophilus]|uniref:glutathione S-transferase N-terminal domain-containing protein n=1 Tax=Salinicola halophilus TaxID=184065 RepID=UPI000DA13B45|nr:glutathione S-transferase N-terminal domain-containing protein [Salinicola halophilus]
MARKMFDLCGRDERLRFSPYCWRVKFALAHKGLDCDFLPWKFTDKEAIAFSGQSKVPVLVDGEETVTDSYEILRYLDRVYPERPLLGDETAEARARFFKHYAERSLAPGIVRTILMDVFNAVHPDDREYFRTSREKAFGCTLEEMHSPEQGLAMLDTALAPMRGRLEESAFLDGDEAGAADYLVAGVFMWARICSTTELVAHTDPVHAWFERILDLHGGVGREATRVADIESGHAG